MSKQAFEELCDKLRTEESVYLVDNIEALWQYFQRLYNDVCPTCSSKRRHCALERSCDKLLHKYAGCAHCIDWEPCPDCKPCKTCGDSKQKREVIAYLDDVPQYAFKTCPDCTEKVKVPNVCPTNWVAPKVLTSSEKPPREHRFVDQRKGQRRVKNPIWLDTHHKDGEAVRMYYIDHMKKASALPDRREGDRRRKE